MSSKCNCTSCANHRNGQSQLTMALPKLQPESFAFPNQFSFSQLNESSYKFSGATPKSNYTTALLPLLAQSENEINVSPGQTLYLPIRLNKTVPPKVGVFIPSHFQPTDAVDLIVYFHGHIIKDCETFPAKFRGKGIEYYWNTPLFTCLREELAASHQNAILLAPTFIPIFATKENEPRDYGDLNRAGKFDFLVNETLAQLKSLGTIPANATIRNIILSGHSGGGLPMQAILNTKNSLKKNIVECWGFECLYFGTSIWENWLAANINVAFRHFRRETKFITATTTLKQFKNFQDGKDGKNHCTIVKENWRQVIDNSQRLQSIKRGANNKSFDNELGTAEAEKLRFTTGFVEENLLKGHPLSSARKILHTQTEKGIDGSVIIEESPAIFVPAILRLAAEQAKNDGKLAIAAQLDPTKYFQQFTRSYISTNGQRQEFTFLGRKLNAGQYIHVELAKLLQKIEAKFVEGLQISSQKAGDLLLLGSNETLAGTRSTSSTAKYSYHMFGLAVDVNYMGNPFIQTGNGIKAINNVLKNAAAVLNTTLLTYKTGTPEKFRFDYVQELDGVLEKYFSLLDELTALERYRLASPTWRSRSLEEVRLSIKKDLELLSQALARGPECDKKKCDYTKQNYFKQHAILNFDKRFVIGMESLGLYWGGHYGDMMHFDMRNTGIGSYINKAIGRYVTNLKNQAAPLFKAGKYGRYVPTIKMLEKPNYSEFSNWELVGGEQEIGDKVTFTPVLHLTQIQHQKHTGVFTRTPFGFGAFFCGDLPSPQVKIVITGKLMIEEKGIRRSVTASILKNLQPKVIVNRIYTGRGVSNSISPVSRIKPDGSFTTESMITVDPGTQRIRVQITLELKGGPEVKAEAIFQRSDLDCFLTFIDSYEQQRPIGRVTGSCQIAFGHFEFLSSVRKMFQPAPGSSLGGLFDAFLNRNRKICQLASVDSAQGRYIRSFENLTIGNDKIDIGHVLVGIEAQRRQRPDSVQPFVRSDATTEALMTWAGDLGSALEPYAEAIVAGKQVKLKTYLDDKASYADLLGNIDGINIGSVYDETKSLSENFRAYYQTKPFRRFHMYLSQLTDESGNPLLSLAQQKPPRLDRMSRFRIANFISRFAIGVIVKRKVSDRLTPAQSYQLGSMVRPASKEMNLVIDYFFAFLEKGLMNE